MWAFDILMDLEWLRDRQGKLGKPSGRATRKGESGEGDFDFLVYGDDRVRHLRILSSAKSKEEADALLGEHVHRWVDGIEASAMITTAHHSAARSIPPRLGQIAVFQFEGDERSEVPVLEISAPEMPAADFEATAHAMASWSRDSGPHLHYLARFLNPNLSFDVRWLNGYRVLEWHFERGATKLAANAAYREFLSAHGGELDALKTGAQQTRHGLLEQVRALAAHAVLSSARKSGETPDIILATFHALEALVKEVVAQLLDVGKENCKPKRSVFLRSKSLSAFGED